MGNWQSRTLSDGFHQVFDKNTFITQFVESQIRLAIIPLYPQSEEIEKCKYNKDRVALVLVEKGKGIGILILKNDPTDEFASLGLKKSVEIKTLLVVSGYRGRGAGKKLLDRAVFHANDVGADSIHVTVSDQVPQAMGFFTKQGFSMAKRWQGKYLTNVGESLLYRLL